MFKSYKHYNVKWYFLYIFLSTLQYESTQHWGDVLVFLIRFIIQFETL